METDNKERKGVSLGFAAIDPYLQSNIVKPTETIVKGRDMVLWGEKNRYPDYLAELSKGSPTLRSILQGTRDFLLGDNQVLRDVFPGLPWNVMNHKGDTLREQLSETFWDFLVYGGFALQVVHSLSGAPVEVYHCPMRYLRSNKENTVFYYSEEWDRWRQEAIEYEAFMPHRERRNKVSSSILYVKLDHSQVYPLPLYCAAVLACETERRIMDFHYNGICNGFVPSVIVNFNNGVPTDEIKEQVEGDFVEKFSGAENAGRMLFSWNDDRTHATTFDVPRVEDFGEKYQALEKTTRQAIFTAFRANPNLFGLPTENNGFNQEEYDSAFRLFNRTVVRPLQRLMCDAYDKIFMARGGDPGVLEITPFTLDGIETQVN